MKNIILLMTLILTFNVYAELSFAPGALFNGKFQSTQTSTTSGKNLFDSTGGFGLGVDFEMDLFFRLSLLLEANYNVSSGTAEYDYTNKLNSTDSATVSNVSTSLASINGLYGLRMKIINTEPFRLFVGGGGIVGAASLDHNKSDFQSKHSNSSTGYKESSSASINGSFFELGIEYFWNKQNGLRFLGRKVKTHTSDFETLGNKTLNLDYTQFGINYIHIVDWKFFWR